MKTIKHWPVRLILCFLSISLTCCGLSVSTQAEERVLYSGPLIPTVDPIQSTSTATSGQLEPSSPGDPSAFAGERWRFGFGVADAADADAWGKQLGAAWYLDWTVAERAVSQMPEHWQMVRLTENGFRPGRERIEFLARTYPGCVWIIGNEPDVAWQGNTEPGLYAERYHELYETIKAADPEARLAVGAIAQVTPLRLAYLDRVLESYERKYNRELPADLWTIHTYVLREQEDSWGVGIPPGFDARQGVLYEVADHARLDLLENQIRAFREWMYQRGYGMVPLAITEFGILMPERLGFPAESVVAYMQASLALFVNLTDERTGLESDDHRLVQQWAWFSLQSAEFPTSDLADLDSGNFTAIGELFRAYTQAGKVGGE